MKIVWLLPTLDEVRGLQQSVLRTTLALRERHHVEVRSTADLDEPALARSLASLEADVVVTTSTALLVSAAAHLPRGPALVHHERLPLAGRAETLQLLRAFAPLVRAIVLPDDAAAGFLRCCLGDARVRVVSVPDPVAPGPLPRTRGGGGVIVSAAKARPESQLALVVKAFADVADELPEWRLRLFGTGSGLSGPKLRSRRLGLFDRVEFVGLTHDMTGEWAGADVAVVSSVDDGLPLALAEAMAAGLPVVALDSPGGPRQLVEHEHTGLLVPPGQPALATALRRLATDPPLRQRLGSAARDAVRDRTPAASASAWEALFVEVLSGEPTPPGPAQPPRPDVASVLATPEEARARITHELTEVAAAVTDGWFVLRPQEERATTVVVPAAARDAFLARLSPLSDLWVLPGTDRPDCVPEVSGHLPLVLAELRRGRAPVLSFGLAPYADGRATAHRLGCGIDVEFWEPAGDDLVAPRENPWTPWVPRGPVTETIGIHGLDLPTLPLAVGATTRDRPFPIDAVYTWVDGTDPAWVARRDQRLTQLTSAFSLRPQASGTGRYADRGELRYSLRSLHSYAPWLRTIHVITDGQAPPWLDVEHPRIRLVDHSEVLAPELLPTFNSHAIETALHRVPDLAEHFVYFNDDVLLGRPLGPEKFFSRAGQFAVFLADAAIGLDTDDALPSHRAALNNRRLLHEDLGLTLTHPLRHTPHPFTRTALREVEARYPEQLRATAAAPFRSDTDLSVASSLAQHIGLVTGAAYEGSIESAYVHLAQGNVGASFQNLLATRDREALCIADSHETALPAAQVERLLGDFFEAYYPVPAPWELPDS